MNIHESIIKKIAEDERVPWEFIQQGLEQGTIVIPMNKNRRLLKPCAVGKGLRTKVNANIGTSQDTAELAIELEKLKAAVGAGADAIMDLSTGGDIDAVRREILLQCPVPLGTVPIYQAAIEAVKKKKSLVEMTVDEIFSVIERQAKDGVDFLTVHCGITSESVKRLKQEGRVASVVSRGGAFTIEWMSYNKAENPLYQYYDRLLDVLTVLVKDGIASGEILPGNTNDMVWTIMACLNVSIEEQLCHKNPRLDGTSMIRMLELVFNGIASERITYHHKLPTTQGV